MSNSIITEAESKRLSKFATAESGCPISLRNQEILIQATFRQLDAAVRNGDDDIYISVTPHGQPYMVLDRDITAELKKTEATATPEELCYAANLNSKFVVMEVQDVQNIVDMLNQAIEKLKSGTTDMDDVEVFGDKSISYARLFDQLQHELLPMQIALSEEKRAAEATGNTTPAETTEE